MAENQAKQQLNAAGRAHSRREDAREPDVIDGQQLRATARNLRRQTAQRRADRSALTTQRTQRSE